MSNRLRWFILLILLALGVASCGRERARYLIITETTHFGVRGSGASLNLPVFAGTLDVDRIVRGVTQAEYYYRKLAPVYGEKSFQFLADSTVELLLERAGALPLAQPVYGYAGANAKLDLSLLAFDGGTAEYLFRVTDPATGQVRDHTVRIPAGESASVGMLFDPQQNRGQLVAIAVKALAITPGLTPDSLAAFLRAARGGPDTTLFRASDQRWMDELFGARGQKLPVAPEPPADSVPMDVAPAVVGGMGALSAHIVYPPAAIRDSVEGQVMVQASISAAGEVTAVRIIKSVRPDLDSAAIRAVQAVRFTPAESKGQPIPVQIAIPFAFKLAK